MSESRAVERQKTTPTRGRRSLPGDPIPDRAGLGWAPCFGIILAFAVFGWGAASLNAVGEELPSATGVLQQVVKRSQNPPESRSRAYFLCTKQTVTEELDTAGRVTDRKVKIGESHLNPSAVKDANKWGSENGVALNEDLLRRYQFTVARREMVNGRSTFVLTFVPKNPPAPVHHFQDRLLNRAMGTIWVDEKDYELVKANLRLGHPVSFGILGAVDALAFSFERIRAEDGNWLTKWTDTFFKGRKFIIPVQIRKRVDCTDFKRLEPQSVANSEN